jgi:hypothetical protein
VIVWLLVMCSYVSGSIQCRSEELPSKEACIKVGNTYSELGSKFFDHWNPIRAKCVSMRKNVQ